MPVSARRGERTSGSAGKVDPPRRAAKMSALCLTGGATTPRADLPTCTGQGDRAEARRPGRLAQWVRARALQARGRRFEPCIAHQPARPGRARWPGDRVPPARRPDISGGVAQLVRVPDCRSGSCGFESRHPRHTRYARGGHRSHQRGDRRCRFPPAARVTGSKGASPERSAGAKSHEQWLLERPGGCPKDAEWVAERQRGRDPPASSQPSPVTLATGKPMACNDSCRAGLLDSGARILRWHPWWPPPHSPSSCVRSDRARECVCQAPPRGSHLPWSVKTSLGPAQE